MTLLDFVLLLVVAGVAGTVGQSIAGYTSKGVVGSIFLGFIGALLGKWVANHLGLPEIVQIGGFPLIWSIIGSALFVAILGMLPRPRRGAPNRRR